ncbi:MAG TPA: endonuclease/exonuclease/phosphatase family protein [Candidatus Limnocylindrales bacterium]|nr:endonuclease/exonuclease/phosphatase family protein [Candidatus Limnocylindrales bacterium]
MTSLHVATVNIRNLMDRWDERLPLLLADFAALQPDVCAMQEVVYPLQQDRVIAAGGAATYAVHRGAAQRPEWGNSLLVRDGLAGGDLRRVDLGYGRAAIRITIDGPAGPPVVVASTHLHHEASDAAIRDEQTRLLIEWLDEGWGGEVQVVMGDFNAPPNEPAYGRMTAAGFRSAHTEANGSEPAATWPSGIVAPGMDSDGDPACLDYIWVRGDAAVVSCRLVFDRPAVGDPTLYPSDHLGLAAILQPGR